MIAYSLKLTLTPGEMTEEDVTRLRAAGWDDRGVHDIAQVVAYYAFVNRMADGLGVELEPSWEDAKLTMTEAELEEIRERRNRS